MPSTNVTVAARATAGPATSVHAKRTFASVSGCSASNMRIARAAVESTRSTQAIVQEQGPVVAHTETMNLLLASASPRRRMLLAEAGYNCEACPMDVDERRRLGESAPAYVERVATLKAEAAIERFPDRIVVAADTVVVVDGDVFGKPIDEADATRMLRRLSGRAHDVLTGLAVVGHRRLTSVESTRVWFEPMTDEDIRWYVSSGEPMDKAGAYAIQGLASRFIPRIDGSYSNVVGLPLAAFARALAHATESLPLSPSGGG
jgi:septum formation protein